MSRDRTTTEYDAGRFERSRTEDDSDRPTLADCAAWDDTTEAAIARCEWDRTNGYRE